MLPAVMGVLFFAYFIELLQYLEFVKWIGFGNNRYAKVVLGNYFEWADILAYSMGSVVVILAEKLFLFLVIMKNQTTNKKHFKANPL